MVQILIIDDDPAIQLLLKRTLEKIGYAVTVASDGEEGLRQAQKVNPALIICDWVMPRMNGLEVCRQIKVTPELSATFFILLTSMGSVEDRVKGLDAGADDFLCKPIEMNELKARVRAGLRLHQLNRDLQVANSELQDKKRLLESELASAAEYVSSILPEPLTQPPVTIDARFIPSLQLGGDGYDYYWLDSEHLAIYLLDIAGHGLRAALPALSILDLLKSRRLPKINYYQPSDVLKGLNEAFQMTSRNDKYFTIWYGVYNKKKRQLVYSCAGHPPGVLLDHHANTVKRLKTPGLPVGMFPDIDYHDATCEIPIGSTLYIFSDGIYEINQPDGSIWGLDALIAALKDSHHQHTTNLDQILKAVQAANPKDVFDDDLSVLQINFSWV